MTEARQRESSPPPPTRDRALSWGGMRIDGLGGKTLGRIAGITAVPAEE